MNKIYSDPIERTKTLMAGVKKQENILLAKGISTDVAALDEACKLLEEAGRKQEAVEVELRSVREDAHKKLEILKGLYADFKTPIKQCFPPETWGGFGLPDKK